MKAAAIALIALLSSPAVAQTYNPDAIDICRRHQEHDCNLVQCPLVDKFDAGFEVCSRILHARDAANRERELAIVRDAAKKLEEGR